MYVGLPSNIHVLRVLTDRWGFTTIVCLISLVAAVMVTARTGFLPLTLVPIIVSAGGTLANGIYFILGITALAGAADEHAPNAVSGRLVALFMADMSWLIQEAGLSFYSYLIVVQLLQGRVRLIFMVVFWTLVAMIATVRIAISAYRMRIALHDLSQAKYQTLLYAFHIITFCLIALVEVICSLTLLVKLKEAHSTSAGLGHQRKSNNLFRHMMRSTAVRLAVLALIGITRGITYSFSVQSHDQMSKQSRIDFCAYLCECAYPFFMCIDLLTTRLVNAFNSKPRIPARTRIFQRQDRIIALI